MKKMRITQTFVFLVAAIFIGAAFFLMPHFALAVETKPKPLQQKKYHPEAVTPGSQAQIPYLFSLAIPLKLYQLDSKFDKVLITCAVQVQLSAGGLSARGLVETFIDIPQERTINRTIYVLFKELYSQTNPEDISHYECSLSLYEGNVSYRAGSSYAPKQLGTELVYVVRGTF